MLLLVGTPSSYIISINCSRIRGSFLSTSQTSATSYVTRCDVLIQHLLTFFQGLATHRRQFLQARHPNSCASSRTRHLHGRRHTSNFRSVTLTLCPRSLCDSPRPFIPDDEVPVTEILTPSVFSRSSLPIPDMYPPFFPTFSQNCYPLATSRWHLSKQPNPQKRSSAP